MRAEKSHNLLSARGKPRKVVVSFHYNSENMRIGEVCGVISVPV